MEAFKVGSASLPHASSGRPGTSRPAVLLTLAQLIVFAVTAALAAVTQSAQAAAVVPAGWFGLSLSLPGNGHADGFSVAAELAAAVDAGAAAAGFEPVADGAAFVAVAVAVVVGVAFT